MRRRNAEWQAFYNTTSLASYHFDLQQVVLDSVGDLILTALANGAPAARFKALPLAAHEYTHWRDNVSTLWGRRLLSTFYRGVSARISDNIAMFSSIVDAKRAIGRCTARRYFRVQGPKSGSQPPWIASLSVGAGFDGNGRINSSDPIPFVRFSVPPAHAGDLVVRMPISAASLSEVRAMYAEYCWITSEEQRYHGGTPADAGKWLAEYSNQVYDQRFLEYTTALHLLANKTGATFVWQILQHASALAGIALNFPAPMVGALRLPASFQAQGPDGAERLGLLLEQRSPGFLYALLCDYAPAPGEDLGQWIDSVLQAAGGFSLAELTVEWEKEIRSEPSGVGQATADYLLKMWLDTGRTWALSSNPMTPPDDLLGALDTSLTLPLPGALSEDFSIWFPTANHSLWNETETQKRIEWLEDVVRLMDEFCDVCGK